MGSVYGIVSRPPIAGPLPDSKPLKFGILGAAAIAPDALLTPAKSHPEAVVVAVAARSKAKGDEYARKHGIAKVYGGPGGYQELLDDPEIDVIYNPLPNGLHYEWTMKALAAGKHVLLEKPAANTADEIRQMFELAEQKNLVLLEAFHYRFHPVVQRVKAIIDSDELGPLKSIQTSLGVHSGLFKSSDIRFDYSLGGGALMDMGCYTISAMRYFAGGDPTSVLSAAHELDSPQVDRQTSATLALPGGVTGDIFCDLGMPPYLKLIPRLPRLGAVIECEGGRIAIVNYVMPTIYHSITVTPQNGKRRVEKVYTFPTLGEPWWTSYRYQLEAFVNKVKGRTPQAWVTKEDSIANLAVIESIYAKTGLGSRPKSEFIPTS
ncbi:NAD(P)-binding protein [Mycena belliarum]|uniref:D-xylose 1-dehydrogenase (NADP(+), D-xylono-1,5-lactone-forming) n=1 Tax=Mycena belliarum TaxID=1033014 RepID=A0AAD6UAV6_9AGAR|nr:NAD(P)-binding protein [Mycena belliae]